MPLKLDEEKSTKNLWAYIIPVEGATYYTPSGYTPDGWQEIVGRDKYFFFGHAATILTEAEYLAKKNAPRIPVRNKNVKATISTREGKDKPMTLSDTLPAHLFSVTYDLPELDKAHDATLRTHKVEKCDKYLKIHIYSDVENTITLEDLKLVTKLNITVYKVNGDVHFSLMYNVKVSDNRDFTLDSSRPNSLSMIYTFDILE